MNNRIYQAPDLYTVLSNRLVSENCCDRVFAAANCTDNS